MLKTTIVSSTKSSIRGVIATGRYIEMKQELEKPAEKASFGVFCAIHDGEQTTFGGEGDIFDNFMKTRQLAGYPGENDKITTFYDSNYNDAKLRLMRFDETFHKCHYDASERKLT